MRTKKTIAAGVAGALSLAVFATAVHAHGTTAQDFVTKVSVANEFEIETSKLALEKSQNRSIKSFAQHMIDDHTKVTTDLDTAIESTTLTTSDLDNKHQKMIDKLEKDSPDQFNKEYVSMQVEAHEEAVKLFTDYSKHGKDRALKSFASAELPTLEEHLHHAKELKAK